MPVGSVRVILKKDQHVKCSSKHSKRTNENPLTSLSFFSEINDRLS